ncbi:sigma-70 family RNA polymerase sigma factor [Dankookia sp. P2]|uniref:sigma-70 family RNA polymerase sigma factor n=1 Tax=Dankookia sp. P2 TaxID=3423955 RepID=UPI003D66EA66
MAGQGEWEAWMVAAQAGDARAYDALLRAALPLLRGVARRRIRDAAEAEDAVQDALLTIHQLRHTYDPARPIRPWLVAICERRAIDRLRRSGRRQGRETPIDDFGETLAAPGTNQGRRGWPRPGAGCGRRSCRRRSAPRSAWRSWRTCPWRRRARGPACRSGR